MLKYIATYRQDRLRDNKFGSEKGSLSRSGDLIANEVRALCEKTDVLERHPLSLVMT